MAVPGAAKRSTTLLASEGDQWIVIGPLAKDIWNPPVVFRPTRPSDRRRTAPQRNTRKRRRRALRKRNFGYPGTRSDGWSGTGSDANGDSSASSRRWIIFDAARYYPGVLFRRRGYNPSRWLQDDRKWSRVTDQFLIVVPCKLRHRNVVELFVFCLRHWLIVVGCEVLLTVLIRD